MRSRSGKARDALSMVKRQPVVLTRDFSYLLNLKSTEDANKDTFDRSVDIGQDQYERMRRIANLEAQYYSCNSRRTGLSKQKIK